MKPKILTRYPAVVLWVDKDETRYHAVFNESQLYRTALTILCRRLDQGYIDEKDLIHCDNLVANKKLRKFCDVMGYDLSSAQGPGWFLVSNSDF